MWTADLRAAPRFAPPVVFGATSDFTIGDTAASMERAIEALLRSRQALVRLGVALRRAGQTLPADAVVGFNRNRRDLAISMTNFVSLINSTLGTSLVDYGLVLLQQVPLLPAELVPPSERSSSNPALARESLAGFAGPIVSFGAVPPLLAITAVVGVTGIALYQILGQFNAQAVASRAESERLAAWAESQALLAESLAAAGLNPEQIAARLADGAPPPPPPGTSLADVAVWVAVAAGIGAVAWAVVKSRKG